MMTTSTTSKEDQIAMPIFVAFLALFDSHQVRGETPWMMNAMMPARFTQMMLAAKSRRAWSDSPGHPEPGSVLRLPFLDCD